MKNRLRKELEAMLELHTGDSFTADNVHTLVNGIFAADEGGGFEFVECDNNAFPYPQTIGSTANSISGLGNADESMMKTIFIMPNKSTNPDATLMIVVDEKEPSTDPKTYQYVYVGNINDLPSDVLTESSIVNDLTLGGTDKPLSAEQGRTLNSHVNYTTCGSGASDEVKLISDDGFELSTHLRLLVMMTNTNTHSTPKFNINNTGVKDVWYSGAVASDTNTWSAGEVLDVYYDGSKYISNTHGGAQFSTGEKVGDVGIDDEPTTGSDNLVKSGGVAELIDTTELTNPTEKALAKAEDVMSFKNALSDIGFTEIKHEITQDEIIPGYVSESGVIVPVVEPSLLQVIKIDVSGWSYVRFLGIKVASGHHTQVYCVFFDEQNTKVGEAIGLGYNTEQVAVQSEFILKIPETAKYFITLYRDIIGGFYDKFYTFLQNNNKATRVSISENTITPYEDFTLKINDNNININTPKRLRIETFVIGNNNTFVYSTPIWGAKRGCRYRFYINDTNPDISGVTLSASFTKLGIFSVNKNKEYTYLVNIAVNIPLLNSYDINIPDDNEYLIFGGRFTQGYVFGSYVEEYEEISDFSPLELVNPTIYKKQFHVEAGITYRINFSNINGTNIDDYSFKIKSVKSDGSDYWTYYNYSSLEEVNKHDCFDVVAGADSDRIIIELKSNTQVNVQIKKMTPVFSKIETFKNTSGVSYRIPNLLPGRRYQVNIGNGWNTASLSEKQYAICSYACRNEDNSIFRTIEVFRDDTLLPQYFIDLTHDDTYFSGIFVRGDANETAVLSITEVNGSKFTELNNILDINEGAIPKTLSKLEKLKKGESDIINIGLFGDSWTHGKEISGENKVSYSYTNDLAIKLFSVYGYAGLGWCDLNLTGGRYMGCAVNNAITITRGGSISTVDKVPSALGITIAHTILNTGGWYNFAINDSKNFPSDSADIWYYGGAKFTYQVNNGEVVQIDDTNTGGWHKASISSSNITNIKITSTANNTIVFGIDFGYGNAGIKVHKLGNSALTSKHVIDVNRDNLIEGLSKLNLDFCSIMLGLNDLATTNNSDVSTRITPNIFKQNIESIADIILSSNNHCDVVLLGEGCSGTLYDSKYNYPITSYQIVQYELSGKLRCPFISVLNELKANIYLGDDRTTIYGTYISNHPNAIGCAIISDKIYKSLFDYDIPEFKTKIVASLPIYGCKNIIYLIDNGGESPNKYDKYLFINGDFEKI